MRNIAKDPWSDRVLPAEIGDRGCPGQSTQRAMTALGITIKEKTKYRDCITKQKIRHAEYDQGEQ